jgi:DNA-binding MarR family transcriptional regulator
MGTQLRHVLELLDGDVAKIYSDLGLDGFRPRYTPLVRVLSDRGPSSIRDLAAAVSVTHSAASQTVAQLARDGLVVLESGTDARQRIVALTPKAHSLLPILDTEWDATVAAAAELEAELPFSLTELLQAVVVALQERPFHQRVTEQLKQRGEK